MRSFLVLPLLGIGLLPVLSRAQSADTAAWDLLTKARMLQTLHQDSSPSFHVSAEFHTFDSTGAPNGDGTLDEVYQKGGNWKRTVVYRGQTLITVQRAHEIATHRLDENYLSTFAEGHVIDGLFEPIKITETMARTKVTEQKSKAGALALNCVIVSLPTVSTMNSKASAPNNAYCIDPQSGLLRILEGHDQYVVIFNKFLKIGETSFVQDVTIRDHGLLRATLHVTKLEANPKITAESFADPEGAVPEFRVVEKPASVVAGVKIGGRQPIYPEYARQNHIQGAVVLNAFIGRDGRVRDLELASTPDDSLVASAMDAVKTWTYKPYMVNDKPVEVSTTITVNYAMTR